jgi:hypothetical protein
VTDVFQAYLLTWDLDGRGGIVPESLAVSSCGECDRSDGWVFFGEHLLCRHCGTLADIREGVLHRIEDYREQRCYSKEPGKPLFVEVMEEEE